MCEIETRELHHQECEIKTGEPHNEECERWEFNDYGEPMDHEEMYPIFLKAKVVPKKPLRKRWKPTSYA